MVKLALLSNNVRPRDLFIMGETLIDHVVDYHQKEHQLLGGSPCNIAVNCTQLGLNVALLSAVSIDDLGQKVFAKLQSYHVDTQLVQRVQNAQSRVHMNQSEATPFPDFFRGSDYNIVLDETVFEVFDQSKIFHFSYWPLTREPALSSVKTLVKRAREQKMLIAFDPNIHDALLHEESISREELFDLLSAVDILKPSLDDAARLFGIKESPEAYLTAFEAFNIPLIMMTLGKEGVLVSHHKERHFFPTVSTQVIDTTGAGDAFWSGFYCGLTHQKSLNESIALAQALSARVLQSIGALVALPSCDELFERND